MIMPKHISEVKGNYIVYSYFCYRKQTAKLRIKMQ